MNSKITRKYAFLMFLLIIQGCGGGGSGGPDNGGSGPGTTIPDQPPEQPPTPDSASIPIGHPALYLSTSSDATVFNNVLGDYIEGNQQQFLQYVPATGEAAIIGSNTSRSYAQSTSFVRTFDDELFLLNVGETAARVQKLDADLLLEAPASIPVPRPQNFDSVNEDCFAVLGDDLLYKVAHREAPFPGIGYADGPLVRIADFFGLSEGRAIETLHPGIGGDTWSPSGYITEACYGNFDVAEGVWYDVNESYSSGEVFIIERDPVTGEPMTVLTITLVAGFDSQTISNFAFDDGRAYVAEFDGDTSTVTISEIDIAGALINTVVSAEMPGTTITGLFSLDVDDGYVSLIVKTDSADIVALFDPTSGLVQTWDFEAPIYDLSVIMRKN